MIHLKETSRPGRFVQNLTDSEQPCPCGSGKKAKRCCMLDPTPPPPPPPAPGAHRIDRIALAAGWDQIAGYIQFMWDQGWEHYESITGREQMGSALDPHRPPPEPILILFLRRRDGMATPPPGRTSPARAEHEREQAPAPGPSADRPSTPTSLAERITGLMRGDLAEQHGLGVIGVARRLLDEVGELHRQAETLRGLLSDRIQDSDLARHAALEERRRYLALAEAIVARLSTEGLDEHSAGAAEVAQAIVEARDP